MHQRERGANLVEAALVIPVLLIMLAFIVDLGRAYFTYITIIDVAREGARYGAAHPTDSESVVCGKAMDEVQGQVLPAPLSCTRASTGASGTPVAVTVSCNYPLIWGSVVGHSSITISHTAAFRIR